LFPAAVPVTESFQKAAPYFKFIYYASAVVK
jgi:hypothetical protein